jgi:arylsulfatase A-like enzyme
LINTDWLPTFLEVAGIRIPPRLDGISLAALLRGKPSQSNRSFRWHFPHYNNQGGKPAGAIRQGDWKLIEYYEDQRRELYNLARDAGEMEDLAEREAGRVKALARELDEWRRSVRAQLNSPNPQFDPEWHRKLYVELDASRYRAASATAEQRQKILEWRQGMDAVFPKTRN